MPIDIDALTAASLADAAATGNRSGYEGEVGHGPGGRWLTPHRYDGPYYLAILQDGENDPHWQTEQVLRAFPAVELRGRFANDLEVLYVTALPQLAWDIVCWYPDEHSGFTRCWDFDDFTFDHMPTDRDLAATLPTLLGLTGSDAVEVETLTTAFTRAHDRVGIAALLRFVRELDEVVYQDPGGLVAVLDGVLTAPGC